MAARLSAMFAFREEAAAADDADEKAADDVDKEAALLRLLVCSLLVGVVAGRLVSVVGSGCLLSESNHKGGAKRPRAAGGGACGCSC